MIPSQIMEMIASEKMLPYRDIILSRREEVYNSYLICEMTEEGKKAEKIKMEYWYPIFIEYFITWKMNEYVNQPSVVNLASFFLAVDDL